MFGEYNAVMEQTLAARGRLMDRARKLLPGIGRQMLCRAALVAYDHLGLTELQPWLTLLQLGVEQASDDSRDDVQRLLLEGMIDGAPGSLQERRAASWRKDMLEGDAHAVAKMVREYNARAAELDANLADLLLDDEKPKLPLRKMTNKAKANKAKAKAKTSKANKTKAKPVVTEPAAAAAAAEEEPDEPEECVVCLDAAATVRIAACGHTLMCETCAAAWQRCPYCA